MNFADFINHILIIKCNKPKSSVSISYFVKCEHGFFDLKKVLVMRIDVHGFPFGRILSHNVGSNSHFYGLAYLTKLFEVIFDVF